MNGEKFHSIKTHSLSTTNEKKGLKRVEKNPIIPFCLFEFDHAENFNMIIPACQPLYKPRRQGRRIIR